MASQPSDPFHEFFGSSAGAGKPTRVLGMTVATIDAGARERYGLAHDLRVVVVTEVEEKSAAAGRGILVGQVIVEADRRVVSRPEQVVGLVEDRKRQGQSSILLLVNRKGSSVFVVLPVSGG